MDRKALREPPAEILRRIFLTVVVEAVGAKRAVTDFPAKMVVQEA